MSGLRLSGTESASASTVSLDHNSAIAGSQFETPSRGGTSGKAQQSSGGRQRQQTAPASLDRGGIGGGSVSSSSSSPVPRTLDLDGGRPSEPAAQLQGRGGDASSRASEPPRREQRAERMRAATLAAEQREEQQGGLWYEKEAVEDTLLATVDACALSQLCLRRMVALYRAVCLPGGLVCSAEQVEGIASLRQYASLCRSVCRLTLVNPFVLTEEERLAFWINIYNCLAMHACVEYGVPTSLFERLSLQKKANYEVGGENYSLYEMEHSVLRACSGKPTFLGAGLLRKLAVFNDSDPRAAACLRSVQPLLSFALCEGVASSAPLRVFQPGGMAQQLREHAIAFCCDSIKVDTESRLLKLPKVMDWYGGDFGGLRGVLVWLQASLPSTILEQIEPLRRAAMGPATPPTDGTPRRPGSAAASSSLSGVGGSFGEEDGQDPLEKRVVYDDFRWDFRYILPEQAELEVDQGGN